MQISKQYLQAVTFGLLASMAAADGGTNSKTVASAGTNIGNGSLQVGVNVNGANNTTVNIIKVSPHATRVNRRGLQQWCSDKLAMLRDIAERAGLARLSGQNREDIIAIYDAGFDELAEGFGEFEGGYSLTQRAIVRGKEISLALGESLVGDEKNLSTRVHFLETYYNFIERVAREVDIPYYIPYYNRGGCNDGCDVHITEEVFAIKLLENARDQLAMVLNKMASVGARNSIFPQGVPAGFLTALEFAAKNAAEDLEESLLYTRMACVIGELHGLSNKLSRYNTGNASEYGGRDDWAVRMSYQRAESQLSEVRTAIRAFSSYNCGGRSDRRDDYIRPEPRGREGYSRPPFTSPEGVRRD